jgi:DNA-binding LacI/PurR family transcriptional regulator
MPERRTQGRSRMARSLLPISYAFALMFLIAGLTATAATLAELTWEATLGVTGLAFGIMAPIVTEYRHLAKESRTVVFIGSSRSSFTENVVRGLDAGLREQIDYKLIDMRPQSDAESVLDFQLKSLRDVRTRNADAVVIRAAADSTDLWLELQSLRRRGVFIVAIDVKPPNRYFYEGDVPMPRFVCSDFAAGGEIVGDELCRRSQNSDGVILLSGPSTNTPSMIRSERACYRVMKQPLACPVLVRELTDLDAAAAWNPLQDALAELDRAIGRPALRVTLFAANDKVAVGLSHRIAAGRDLPRREIAIIGYDGVRGTDGALVVQSAHLVVATVDTLPDFQGREAAAFLVAEFFRHEAKNRKNSVVSPRLFTVESGWS